MIQSYKEGPIVYMDVEGAFSADEFAGESVKWLGSENDDIIGFLVDMSKMTSHPAMEQRKAEAEFKKMNPNWLRAIIVKDDASTRFIKIYMRFTKAERMKFFTNQEEAKDWLLNYK